MADGRIFKVSGEQEDLKRMGMIAETKAVVRGLLMRALALILLLPSLSFAYGDADEAEVVCLAENIYHEARGEGIEGMLAVGHVTMNRVESSRFPDTVCGVVRQTKYIKSWRTGELVPARNRCQFSWYCDGRPEVVNKESKIMEELDVDCRCNVLPNEWG